MAKKSMVERERKRARTVQRFQKKRMAIKNLMKDQSLSPEERLQACLSLQSLPRNASPSRLRNRCVLTGITWQAL